jgi:ParB/RepB/Spo0J family partition protein
MSAIEVKMIPVNTIAAPSYVRTQNGHDKESLQQLADSIKAHGLLQPIVVRPMAEGGEEINGVTFSDGWVVVAGRRRLAAFKLAKLDEIPALVTATDEARSYELEIAENIQREQMTLADTARAVRTLMTIYNDAKTVGRIVNKSPAWVSKHLALTASNMPSALVDIMDRGLVSDLETLGLLRQIALVPASNPAAASTLTRMLRIANEGNMNRQIARDALAKLRSPAQEVTAPPSVARVTRTSIVQPGGNEEQGDPTTHFTIELPIEVLEALERITARLDKPSASILAEWITEYDALGK